MVAKATLFGSALVGILVAVNWFVVMKQQPKGAWMTLLTNDKYLQGALTLDYSIKKYNSKYPLVVFHPDTLEAEAIQELHKRNIATKLVKLLLPTAHKDYGPDERFYDCWSKLLPHGMIEYDRIVELDADMLLRQNADELMEMELPYGTMAATHACVCNPKKKPHYPADWIPENCAYTRQAEDPSTAHLLNHTVEADFGLSIMNGGLQVVNPNKKHFNEILEILNDATLTDTFAFADQSLLSHYFKHRWTPLPYTYNALKTLREAHSEIWRDEHAKIIHYILSDKPWDDPSREKSDFVPNVWWWETNNERLAEEMIAKVRAQTDDIIASNKVVLFSKSYCPHCRAAKATLSGAGVKYTVIELDQDPNGSLIQQHLSSRSNVRTVPQLFVNQKFIGGNSDLQAIARQHNGLTKLFA